jgi:streptogramin lyase
LILINNVFKWSANMRLINFVFLGCVVITQACGGRASSSSSSEISVSGVTLSKYSLGLQVGELYKLEAVVSPINASNTQLTWNSENSTVATVDPSGQVSAITPGMANITVRTNDGNFTATVTVIVSESNIPASGITVFPVSLSLFAGSSQLLKYNIIPENSTNPEVVWNSSNSSVAVVNSMGVVSGVASGSAVVTATTVDGGYAAASVVKILPAPTYFIGGSFSGLNGGRVSLLNNAIDSLSLTADGIFQFPIKASRYSVTVSQQPLGFQWCSVSNGVGVGAADVTNIFVNCDKAVVNVITYGRAVQGPTLGNPRGVVADPNGNLYVADSYNHLIRKIDSSGDIVIFAGSYPYGSGNNDGQISNARFTSPRDLSLDVFGNVYVADTGNSRIRKIDSSGNVTTLAGSMWGYTDGQGTAAEFATPEGISVDVSGNVYVADTGNNRIRIINSSANVTTIAGSGAIGSADGQGMVASFNEPYSVAVDSSGNIYVADTGNHRIRRIDPLSNVTTLAGSGVSGSTDGHGTAATFNRPHGVSVDISGNVYVADTGNNSIRKIDPFGNVTTLAGSAGGGAVDGLGAVAMFNMPYGVSIDMSGNLYVADSANNSIRKLSPMPFGN